MLVLATANKILLKFMSLLSESKLNPSVSMWFSILNPGLWDSSGAGLIFGRYEPGAVFDVQRVCRLATTIMIDAPL
jgi:hypothetical protein